MIEDLPYKIFLRTYWLLGKKAVEVFFNFFTFEGSAERYEKEII